MHSSLLTRGCALWDVGPQNYVELCLYEWAAMGDVCRLSWQPPEKRAIRRFSPSGAWGEIVCLSGLSVWMMRAVIKRVRLCVCARRVRVCVPVLTATWQRALSGVQKGRILRHVAFKNCSLAQTATQIFSVEAATVTAWITLSSVWHNRGVDW